MGSALINVGVVFFLMWIAQKQIAVRINADESRNQTYDIYYIPPEAFAKSTLPKITPSGPGGAPGQGELQIWLPRLGSTAFHNKITAISQPLRPDNTHQTVIQPNIPMDVRLLEDLHLPNMVLVNSLPQPKRPVTIQWHAPVPNPAKTSTLAPATPAATSPDSTLVVTGVNMSAPALPVVQPPASEGIPSTQKSSLPVDNTLVSDTGSGEGGTLVVLSTDPGVASGVTGLPVGNRAGTFSISPYGGSTGSPGGNAGSPTGGGSTSKGGSGGDGSVGVGVGKTGGGGGGEGNDSGMISLDGTNSGSGGGSLVAPSVAEEMVVRLAPFTPLRKNGLIVSAGLMGGGGLGVYQALECRKIYTIFIPMPGTSWTLQYCTQDEPDAKQAVITSGGGMTVHIPQGLVPPAPEVQFDFKRLPIPPEKAGKMIVLKGAIRDDGTVENVTVYAGVSPLMDEAARLAFSRWKFAPALRLGKPVGVQILVGIATATPKP